MLLLNGGMRQQLRFICANSVSTDPSELYCLKYKGRTTTDTETKLEKLLSYSNAVYHSVIFKEGLRLLKNPPPIEAVVC